VTCERSPGDDFENMREALGVDLLFNSIPADAFSTIVHRDKSYAYGSRMCES
jgi:translation elongation factor EF-4